MGPLLWLKVPGASVILRVLALGGGVHWSALPWRTLGLFLGPCFFFLNLKNSLSLHLLIYCVWECQAIVCMWKSEGDLQMLVLSLYLGV